MSCLKSNKIFLKEDVENKIRKTIENKVNVNNAAVLYNFSTLYNLSSLSKLTLCIIQRCFQLIADSQKFLELGFTSFVKIISCNELNCDSELEVFRIADRWLSYNIKERSKYMRDIFCVFVLSCYHTTL